MIVKMKNLEPKAAWLAELRSGKYRQGKGLLRFYDKNWEEESLCCLGVASELCVQAGVLEAPTFDEDESAYDYIDTTPDREDITAVVLPEAVQKWLGFDPFVYDEDEGHEEYLVYVDDPRVNSEVSLSTLNDQGFTFEEIANIIEEQL
jgi:hypothetical protein